MYEEQRAAKTRANANRSDSERKEIFKIHPARVRAALFRKQTTGNSARRPFLFSLLYLDTHLVHLKCWLEQVYRV
jgi:hypothetical protein